MATWWSSDLTYNRPLTCAFRFSVWRWATSRVPSQHLARHSLADELDGVAGIDGWLEAERALGATIGRQVMEAARPGDAIERRLDNLDPLTSWAQALSGNLRRFRSVGLGLQALSNLQANAGDLVKTLHERHGWNLPPEENPRLEPLV